MGQVTGGTVSVEDGTKKAEEYSPARKVRVELHFDVGAGEDHEAHLTNAGLLASAHVAKLLGTAPKPVTAKIAAAASDKAKEAYAAKAVTPGPKATPAPKAPTPPANDPSAIVEEDVTAVDEFASPAVEAKVITDADLSAAITKKNSVLKNAVLIRGLIDETVNGARGTGKAAAFAMIPAEKRPAFLIALDALQAAA